MCRLYFFSKTYPITYKKAITVSTSLSKCFTCQKSLEGLTIPGYVGYSTFVKFHFELEAGEEENWSHSWMKVVPQFMNDTDLK